MKPFVINRYGRIVFPFNFFPALDFSVFETLDQFAAVIKRDFEEKAPTEVDIVAKVDAHAYNRSEEHTSELQSLAYLVCRLLLEKKKTFQRDAMIVRIALLSP